tara:strand:+ start:6998 stop:8665 length:1668 start_codon:yes stop_codon:yes gene_type:complete
MSRKRAACCCVRGNDDGGGPDDPTAEDCFGHVQESPRLEWSIDGTDLELFDTNAAGQGGLGLRVNATCSVKMKSIVGVLLSADFIISSGWYSDQWWKWDVNAMQGIKNIGIGRNAEDCDLGGFGAFGRSATRCNLRNGDEDEPDMAGVHAGMCPAPFSDAYLDSSDEGAVTASSWFTRAGGRSVVVKSEQSAYFELTPRYPENVHFPIDPELNEGTGQPQSGIINAPGGIARPRSWNLDNRRNAAYGGCTHTLNSSRHVPNFKRVMSAEMECFQEGTKDTMRTRYEFRAWFGRLAQFDQQATRNLCQGTFSTNNGSPFYPNFQDDCNFQMPCYTYSSNIMCPCEGGNDAPDDGETRFGIETCNSMYDGTCGRFCRCKFNKLMYGNISLQSDDYQQCTQTGINTFDGCDLNTCGAGCMMDCYQSMVGQCNCPPFSPNNYWRDRILNNVSSNQLPYDPPLFQCSSLCETQVGGNLCFQQGCTAPEANFPTLALRDTVQLQYPYEDVWLEGNLSPQEYFAALSDEQNVAKTVGLDARADPEAPVTSVDDKLRARLVIA